VAGQRGATLRQAAAAVPTGRPSSAGAAAVANGVNHRRAGPLLHGWGAARPSALRTAAGAVVTNWGWDTNALLEPCELTSGSEIGRCGVIRAGWFH